MRIAFATVFDFSKKQAEDAISFSKEMASSHSRLRIWRQKSQKRNGRKEDEGKGRLEAEDK